MKKKSSQNGQKGSVDKVVSSYPAAINTFAANAQTSDTLIRPNVWKKKIPNALRGLEAAAAAAAEPACTVRFNFFSVRLSLSLPTVSAPPANRKVKQLLAHLSVSRCSFQRAARVCVHLRAWMSAHRSQIAGVTAFFLRWHFSTLQSVAVFLFPPHSPRVASAGRPPRLRPAMFFVCGKCRGMQRWSNDSLRTS